MVRGVELALGIKLEPDGSVGTAGETAALVPLVGVAGGLALVVVEGIVRDLVLGEGGAGGLVLVEDVAGSLVLSEGVVCGLVLVEGVAVGLVLVEGVAGELVLVEGGVGTARMQALLPIPGPLLVGNELTAWNGLVLPPS